MSRIRTIALLAALVTAPASSASAQGLACHAPQKPVMEVQLLFGRDISGKVGISEAQWRAFLASEVTPRFPDGLTVYDAYGQWRHAGIVVRGPSKMLRMIVLGDAPADDKIEAIAAAYRKRFRQGSVRVLTGAVCVSF